MYGFLLESVRFAIRRSHGDELWESLCRNCELSDTTFTLSELYSDALIPKLADSCSTLLPCGQTSAAYMEYFGKCFVEFTSNFGYSKVLKAYGRNFRDLLDGIDSLHEHLRFGFPKLQSPSFECKEESSSGLTLHYRSRRHGYKSYVIGQVKDTAWRYFKLKIDVKILYEENLSVQKGARKYHIVFRIIFDNARFMPVLRDSRFFGQKVAVPVDLVFSISPFSFLIDKDLRIFRASSDLNHYFGDDMAGKKFLDVFIVRRPPTDITWEELIYHGRIIFELIAKQACNMSLFTKANSEKISNVLEGHKEFMEQMNAKSSRSSSSQSSNCRSSSPRTLSPRSSNCQPKSRPKSWSMSFSRQYGTLNGESPEVSCALKQCDIKTTETYNNEAKKTNANTTVLLCGEEKSCPNGIIVNDVHDITIRRPDSIIKDAQSNKAMRHSDLTTCNVAYDKGKHYSNETTVNVVQDTGIRRPNPTTKVVRCKNKKEGTDTTLGTVSCDYELLSSHTIPGYVSHDYDEKVGPSAKIEKISYETGTSEKTSSLQQVSCDKSTKLTPENGVKHLSGVETRLSGDNLFQVPSSKTTTENCAFDNVVDISNSNSRASCNSTADDGKVTVLSERIVTVLGENARDISRRTTPNFLPNKDSANPYTALRDLTSDCKAAITCDLVNTEACPMDNTAKLTSNKEARSRVLSEPNTLYNNLANGTIENEGKFSDKPPDNVLHSEASRPSCPLWQNEVSSLIEQIGTQSPPSLIKNGCPSDSSTSSSTRLPSNCHSYSETENKQSTHQAKPGSNQWSSKIKIWLQRQQYKPLHLRGQMKYIKAWDMVLFIGTPLIGSVSDLFNSGLFLSDLSMHDNSRILAIQGNQRLSELEFACERERLKGELLTRSTRKLEEEKRRTEELLYSMMPREIAERMKNGDRELTTCESFDNVTILFGCIHEFTNICSKLGAMQVVRMVSQVFSLFDTLSEKYDVYKFETIGGGVYMLVSGMPVKIKEHAREMAVMALHMLEEVQTLKNPLTGKPLEYQIGIHTGPVVAGVIGQTTLQYCLFGNTVNVSSRMQSTGKPMRIHLSEATYKQLNSSDLITEHRGQIPVKGVGYLTTYWLIGKRDPNKVNGIPVNIQNNNNTHKEGTSES